MLADGTTTHELVVAVAALMLSTVPDAGQTGDSNFPVNGAMVTGVKPTRVEYEFQQPANWLIPPML